MGKRRDCLFFFYTRVLLPVGQKDRAQDQWEAFTQSKKQRQLVVTAGVSGKPHNPKQVLNNIRCQPTASLLLLCICCSLQDLMLQWFECECTHARTLTANKKCFSQ